MQALFPTVLGNPICRPRAAWMTRAAYPPRHPRGTGPGPSARRRGCGSGTTSSSTADDGNHLADDMTTRLVAAPRRRWGKDLAGDEDDAARRGVASGGEDWNLGFRVGGVSPDLGLGVVNHRRQRRRVYWWCVVGTQLGTPRGRYDAHSNKFPSVWNQGLIEPVGERTNFQRLM
jgi:hypothetical protein